MSYLHRLVTLVILGTVAGTLWGAPPQEIAYQGLLKDGDTLVTDTRRMLFRITNRDGTQVYWSSNELSVSVSKGVFSAVLMPAGVDWTNVVPYLEVSVEGQRLEPRERLTATPYALVSHRVVDGGVTLNQLAAPVQDRLLPAGLIALFANACPAGWSRFNRLDGRFPMGASSYGATGGSATHGHAPAGDHNHGGGTAAGGADHTHGLSGRTTTEDRLGITFERFEEDGPQDAARHAHTHSFSGGTGGASASTHAHGIPSEGAHTHGNAEHLPPFLEVVFCQKN